MCVIWVGVLELIGVCFQTSCPFNVLEEGLEVLRCGEHGLSADLSRASVYVDSQFVSCLCVFPASEEEVFNRFTG